MTTKFESDVKTINTNEIDIFNTLSDLRNVEKIKDRIPEDKVKDITLDQDSISFVVNPVGSVCLRITEREEFQTIKFTAEKSPIDFFLWIQLKQVSENETKLKVTIKADMNPMIKMMATKPLNQFINMLADALATLPYTSESTSGEIEI